MDTWRIWFARPQAHMEALRKLYTMASTDVPVEERQMAVGENNLRPHLIHLNRCPFGLYTFICARVALSVVLMSRRTATTTMA